MMHPTTFAIGIPAVVTVAVLALLAPLMGWWTLVVVLVLAAAGLFLYLLGRNTVDIVRPHRTATRPAARTADPQTSDHPTAQRVEITDVPLLSTEKDYHFLFGATVWWHPTTDPPTREPAHLCGPAAEAVTQRARQLAESEAPLNFALVRHKLASALAESLPDARGQLTAWAVDVTLTLPEKDVHRLDLMAHIRKDTSLWEHERERERSMRTYLRDDALRDTSNAVIWWLAKDTTKVEETTRLITTLSRLSDVATGADGNGGTDAIGADSNPGTQQTLFPPHTFSMPTNGSSPATRVITGLREGAADLATEDREGMVDRLAHVFEAYEKHDIATKLREAFTAPRLGPDHHRTDAQTADGPSGHHRPEPPRTDDIAPESDGTDDVPGGSPSPG